MIKQITIHKTTLPVVEYQGKRVVTFAMVDNVHERVEGTAKRNFQENRHRFIEGVDTYLIEYSKKNVLREWGVDVQTRGLRVVTESGYLMLVKSLTDDLAWEVQRQLVNNYFRAESVFPQLPNFSDPVAAARAWADEKEQTLLITAERDEAIRTKAEIGSRREATAMATASKAVRERDKLSDKLGQSTRCASITAVQNITGTQYPWRPLSDYCKSRGLEPTHVICDRYGKVRSYPAEAWLFAHDIDLHELFGEGI